MRPLRGPAPTALINMRASWRGGRAPRFKSHLSVRRGGRTPQGGRAPRFNSHLSVRRGRTAPRGGRAPRFNSTFRCVEVGQLRFIAASLARNKGGGLPKGRADPEPTAKQKGREGTEQPTGLPQDGGVRSADRELRAKAATSGCAGAAAQGGRGRSADRETWASAARARRGARQAKTDRRRKPPEPGTPDLHLFQP